jgi:hypothetical protein
MAWARPGWAPLTGESIGASFTPGPIGFESPQISRTSCAS